MKAVIEWISNNVSDIANTIMAIASVVNLFVVIWVFKKEEKSNISKSKKEEKNSWYNSLGIKKMTTEFSDEINNLKEESIKYTREELLQEEYINKYKSVEMKFLKYKNEYLTIVDCLDSEMVQRLTTEFQDIQDELYTIMTDLIGDRALNKQTNEQEITITFDNIRKRIIKMSINLI